MSVLIRDFSHTQLSSLPFILLSKTKMNVLIRLVTPAQPVQIPMVPTAALARQDTLGVASLAKVGSFHINLIYHFIETLLVIKGPLSYKYILISVDVYEYIHHKIITC